ncbi:MAG: sigma-54-dependent Fis family transcriptional regulator [Pseudobdellovibrionaceae bacterium]|nr:sigma-54-dependent Fis family transcriptional regulator [Bdellovibrionales bacterium]USN47812.1 MAG: sigma-54-dependent Fis family transcriptional regulator [Pseudobdellovibrionaceae bacterium]
MSTTSRAISDTSHPVEESLHVLVIDDDEDIRRLLRATLEREGFRVKEAESFDTMRSQINAYSFDAAIIDVYLNNEDGLEVMSYLIHEAPYTKVFIMTAQDTVSLAVDAMERGAASFLPKSMGPKKMVQTLKDRFFDSTLRAGPKTGSVKDMGLIGNGPSMRKTMTQIQQMKDADSTVLIMGESGTGKELIARALHKSSRRKGERFEAINCGAIPEALLESELFGHLRGAFTDAKTDKKGLFEICKEGTLVLDEIGDMPLSLQVKLLRVLQEREVRPLGSLSTVKVNTRVIASTHRDLAEEVRAGRFRQDLYFRLSVLQIYVPSLKERPEDIPMLVEHFVERYSERFGKRINQPSHEVMSRLTTYAWPGNIRELQNAIERAVVLTQDCDIHIDHLFCHARHDSEMNKDSGDAFLNSLPLCHSDAKKLFERSYLEQLLKESRGNISKAARLAGKHRVEIYRLIEKYNIDHHRFSETDTQSHH